jgi:hypothetical protein
LDPSSKIALALGIPSIIIASLALWVAYKQLMRTPRSGEHACVTRTERTDPVSDQQGGEKLILPEHETVKAVAQHCQAPPSGGEHPDGSELTKSDIGKIDPLEHMRGIGSS